MQSDVFFNTNQQQLDQLMNTKPWKNQHLYFTTVKITSIAATKILQHAIGGGTKEVMGTLTGKIEGCNFYIWDIIELPVESTETRVNAGSDALEHLCNMTDLNETLNRQEFSVGWYHSHPSYGCWLSGIDVETQQQQQLINDPYVALVVDPIKSQEKKILEIGAFRTIPKDRAGQTQNNLDMEDIPYEKVQDFGMHYKFYYTLKLEIYESSAIYSGVKLNALQKQWNRLKMDNKNKKDAKSQVKRKYQQQSTQFMIEQIQK